MGQIATIVAGALSGLKDCLTTHGIDQAALGVMDALPLGAWTNPEIEIPLFAFVRLYEAGARIGNFSDIGWSTGRDFDLAHLGDIGQSILSASTLGAALRTFAGFSELIQSETEIRLDVDGSHATISYRILNPDIWPRRQDAEFTLSVFHHLIRSVAGPGWTPDLMVFEHEPNRPVQGYCESARADCRFTQLTNALTFPTALLDRPMPRADRAACRHLSTILSARLHRHRLDMPVARRVAQEVYIRLGRDPADQTSIARALGLSRRTLHRRLIEERTSFSAVLDHCRTRLACHQLSHGERSLSDIALSLGYSDQSAFGRAFRASAGMTPRRYRAEHGIRPDA